MKRMSLKFMKKYFINQIRTFILVIILFNLLSGVSISSKKIHLATSEREPYIGSNLPNKGYVHELVTKVFSKVGYEVEIKFYPLARAKNLSKFGEVDGFLPSYNDKSMEKFLVFSAPFPGDNIGLLKKKSLSVSYSVDPRENLSKTLEALQNYEFGIVRGASVCQYFDQANFLKKQFVTTDLQNIDKIEAGRMDFAVIDKYTAADLMVNNRPHLIGKLEFIHPPLVSNSFHIAFSKKAKNYQQLKDYFDRGLSILKKNGDLTQILEKHGLYRPKINTPGKKKLVIGVIDSDDIKMIKTLSKEFEELDPDITLDWRFLEENVLRKRLLSDIAVSDGQFDIMMIGSYESPIWGKNKWLHPFINLPKEYDLKDVVETVRKGLSYQNNLYALPFYAESTMTFYRKDLFEKAGIKMPANPTYHEIMKFAGAVHDPDNGIYGIGLRGKPGWGQNMAFISILVHTYGGRWFDENWKPAINTKEWKNALNYYKEIMDKYGHPNKVDNGWYENQKLFADGHLGIIVDATSLAGRLFNPKFSIK